jgi:carbonic anhydrase
MIIACSDSRVDPIADLRCRSRARVFVVRNVAAMVPAVRDHAGPPRRFGRAGIRGSGAQGQGNRRHGPRHVRRLQGGPDAELHGTEPGEGGFIADWIAPAGRCARAGCRGARHRGARRRTAMEKAGVKVSLATCAPSPASAARNAAGELRLTGAFFAISDGLLHVLDEAKRPVRTDRIAQTKRAAFRRPSCTWTELTAQVRQPAAAGAAFLLLA